MLVTKLLLVPIDFHRKKYYESQWRKKQFVWKKEIQTGLNGWWNNANTIFIFENVMSYPFINQDNTKMK